MRRNRIMAASTDNRIQDFITKTPLVTLSLLVFNISIHVLLFLSSWNIGPYVYNPSHVLYNGEYYRVFSSAFIHGGIMHIGMNMMSLIALGGVLEPAFGSIRFFWLTWLAIIWEGIISTFLSWLWAAVMKDPSFMMSNSVGFSGVLFAYAVIESFHSYETSRSLFGIISFPTKVYPFALLIVLQFILPNVSLIGHLGGILAGMVLMTSVGYNVSMLSHGGFEMLETLSCCAPIRRLSSYRILTTKEMIHPSLEFRDSSNLCVSLCSILTTAVLYVLTMIWQVLVTIAHIVGIPADRCQGWGNQCYWLCCQYPLQLLQSVGSMIGAVWTAIRTGGYAAVPTEEDESVHNGGMHGDVELGTRFPAAGGRTLGSSRGVSASNNGSGSIIQNKSATSAASSMQI